MALDRFHSHKGWLYLIAASLVLAFIVASTSVSAFASQEQASRKLEIWQPRLEDFKNALKQPDLSDKKLAEIKTELDSINRQALELKSQLLPALQKLQQQYSQLGPKPDTGIETKEVTQKRKDLNKQLGVLSSLIKQLDVTAVRASQIADWHAQP